MWTNTSAGTACVNDPRPAGPRQHHRNHLLGAPPIRRTGPIDSASSGFAEGIGHPHRSWPGVEYQTRWPTNSDWRSSPIGSHEGPTSQCPKGTIREPRPCFVLDQYLFVPLSSTRETCAATPASASLAQQARCQRMARQPRALRIRPHWRSSPAAHRAKRHHRRPLPDLDHKAGDGAARGARWAEIDLESATWAIPAKRMKANGEHRVPLSRQALDTLKAAETLDDGSGLVFPSPLRRGEPLSWQALLKLLRTYELDTTVHGFRSAFKTWCIEQTAAPWAVGEAAPAHVVGNSVEAAYVRTDLFDQRRHLMQDWANYVAP